MHAIALSENWLVDVPSGLLTARLRELRGQERAMLVEFLGYLGEVDRRRLYLELGFGSLFSFCMEQLGLTRASAFRRTTAARLLRRFPVLAEYLADGRLCLTTLVELRDVLDESRLDEILTRAAGRTEEQVKALVAGMAPRAAVPDLLRRLPIGLLPSSGPALNDEKALPPNASRPASVEPISEELRVLRMTVGSGFVADLEAVRAALSHQLPDGRLERVLHHCVRVTLEACERRRRGSGRGSGGKDLPISTRYIPAAIRDAVWRRDESRCAFVAEGGQRCGSTHKLQLHHVVPFARGGASTLENLSLRCANHNAYHAEQDYGAEHIRRARGGRQEP